MATKTGFIKDYKDNILLPITRAELVKDVDGECAFHSKYFAATEYVYGLMSPEDKAKLNGDGDQSLSGLDALIKQLSTSIKVDNVTLDLLSTGLTISDSDQIEATVDKGTLKFTLPANLPLTSATVTTVDNTQDNAVVNRKWVSDKIQAQFEDAMKDVTGSLKFKGLLEESVTDTDLNKKNVGEFYKVGSNDVTVSGTSVKRGDTVLVADNGGKYWCIIPSGDEIETTLSVNSKRLLGSINIASADPTLLQITANNNNNDGGGTITFTPSVAQVANGKVIPGAFTQDIYDALSSQITTGVKYTSYAPGEVAVGTLGEAGSITIPKLIVSAVNNNAPTIKYNTVQNDGIKITSGDGIAITRSSNSELSAALRVATSDQLNFNTSGALQLNVWKESDTNNPNGLITFDSLVKGVGDNVLFIEVTEPKNLDDDEKAYLVFENNSTNN